MPTAYIDDQLYLESDVQEFPGVHPELKFTYRLAGPHLIYQYGRISNGLAGKAEVETTLNDILTAGLHELYYKDDNGEFQRDEHDAKTVGRIWANARVIIAEHIVGWRRPQLKKS